MSGRSEALALDCSSYLTNLDPEIRATGRSNAFDAGEYGSGQIHPLKMRNK
jgi:hypothetical protein